MKKIIFALLAVAALASCAKTEEAYTEGQNEIKMAPVTSYVTKTVYNAIDGVKYPKAEEFGVWAYWDGDAANPNKVYLENKVFANSGIYWAGKNDTYYWPKNGNLRFSCYSPAVVPGVAHDPENDVFTVNYTQSSNTAETIDFMLSPITVPYNAHTAAENVAVVFEHTLAWITIKVKAANADAAKAFTIHDLIINDVYTNADLTADMNDGVQYKEWENANTPAAYNVVLDGDINLTTIARVAENVENGTVVIPQVPTTLTINFTQNEMKEDNGDTATPELKEQTLTIPLELNNEEDNKWHPGKHYIYTIVFDLEEIVINPSVADWEDVIVDEKDDNDDGYINTAATEEQLLEALAANVEEIELTDVIALSSALTIDYNTTIVGGGFTGKPVHVTGETVAFYDVDFANATEGNESSVYVNTGNKNITFDNCSFEGYKWEAIQYVAENADWACVTGCSFKSDAVRALHMQVKNASNAEVKVTNNIFEGTYSDSYVTIYGFEHERMILEANSTATPANTVNVWISDVFNYNNLTLRGFVTPAPYKGALSQSAILNGNYNGAQMVLNGNDLDGNGYFFNMEKSDVMFGVTTSKGYITNLFINGYNERNTNGKVLYGVVINKNEGNVVLNNVHVSNTAYALNTQTSGNCDYTLTVENSSLEGWTSYSSFKSAKFINTAFYIGDFFKNEDPTVLNEWNATVKPYVTSVFEGCSFEKGCSFDLSVLAKDATVTLKNCTVDGVVLTAGNVAAYLNGDVDNLKF
ncbi:MAG: fimbrillin family protein [Bacteroidales bacterium]|nr:fimbrillin family protein [Bacteroidales bacterium]